MEKNIQELYNVRFRNTKERKNNIWGGGYVNI